MQAEVGDADFRQAGIDRVISEFGAYRNTEATLILAGSEVRQAGSGIDSAVKLTDALEKWRCESERVDWPQAFAFAQSLNRGWPAVMAVTHHLT